MKRLVIDLGHGGYDFGAIGLNKMYESNIVLAIGNELNRLLKDYDIEVKFTRISDTYISLTERARIANDFKADYFISIHVNSTTDNSVRGTEIWQYSNKHEKLNRFSNSLCKDISNIFNVTNRGIKLSKNLFVLRHTKMPAALIEVDFISNIKAEKELSISDNIKAIASVIKDNLLELLELNKTESNSLYRVCIGAYNDKNNAINQIKLAKDKGFTDAYII